MKNDISKFLDSKNRIKIWPSKNGEFDAENFKKYLARYNKYASLNDYDVEIMPSFYMYQNLVCDYFYQYYHSKYKNKNILLKNAMHTYKQCKALSDIIEKGILLV